MFDHKLPHVQSFDPALVRSNQPWLTDEQWAYCELIDSQVPAFSGMFTHFILTEDMRIIEEPSGMRWSMFLSREHRKIHLTSVQKGRPSRQSQTPDYRSTVEVSTVFLGTCADELFETMIFGGWLNFQKWRTATLIDAKKTHWAVVRLAQQHQAFMRRRGKWAIKQWRRVEKFWSLARKRGETWAMKHIDSMERVMTNLELVPGRPPTAQPNFLLELMQMVQTNPSLVPDLLLDTDA